MTPQDDLALARGLADAADRITMGRFGAADLRVEAKSDSSPVTDADRAVEAELRRRLAASRPGDAVLGEEYGDAGSGARRWVIDPIDGTKNFVRGVPVWATLVALREGEQTLLGVASAPALGRRWEAALGAGAWLRALGGRPRRLAVSGIRRLEEASLSYSSLGGWAAVGRRDAFLALTAAVARSRAYGDFWSYLLVAEGAVDVAIEPEVSEWDLAACQVIVEEAGGRFTDLSGRRGPAGGSAVASNGVLHAQVVDRLRAAR